MFRRFVCILSAWFSLLVLGQPVRAAQLGTVRILPGWEGHTVTDGEVTLYRMGEPVPGGYRVSDGLADWTVWQEELAFQTTLDWILGLPRPVGDAREITDETGACYEELKEGLYLAVQSRNAGEHTPFLPFLVAVPQEDRWEIMARPGVQRTGEAPNTGDHPAPIVGAMALGLSIVGLMGLFEKFQK